MSGRRLAPILAALLALTACTSPSQPDDQAWVKAARQSLEDASSEVATVRLVIEQRAAGNTIGKYAVTVAVTSEEAAGKATDSLTTLQPSPGRKADAGKVGTALGDAEDLITDARVALVDNDTAELRKITGELKAMTGRLDRLGAGL